VSHSHIAHRSEIGAELQRRSWLLWGITFAILLALAAAIPMLYLQGLSAVGQRSQASYSLIGGLITTIVAFCVYLAYKHVELERMREALRVQEQSASESRTRLQEMLGLFEVTAGLDVQMRADSVLEIVVRRMVSALGAQQASIMLYNPQSGMLETRATYGLEAEFARHARARLGEGIAGWVAQRREAVLLGPSSERHALSEHYKDDRNITSALSVPLRMGERCLGVINVNRINHSEPFTEHHRDILVTFAEHAGTAIERVQALETIGQRSRQLEDDNQRLTEVGRLRDLFLSTATHELKTPLTAVIAYAELLHESDGKLDAHQRGEFLKRLRLEAERLLMLIEDILDLTRIESGRLDLKRVSMSLNEVVTGAVETSKPTAKKHGVELRAVYDDSLPAVPMDEVKMRQVVVNLIVNAIRFSPKDGIVTVATTREPRFLKIEVRDQGPGVTPDQATHMFELFGHTRDEKAAREASVGIGLHLVKRLAELHGGHVGVNSVPGEGSSFWVRLPLALAEAEAQPAPAEVQAAA
jgi:signal transduction histidine kinase